MRKQFPSEKVSDSVQSTCTRISAENEMECYQKRVPPIVLIPSPGAFRETVAETFRGGKLPIVSQTARGPPGFDQTTTTLYNGRYPSCSSSSRHIYTFTTHPFRSRPCSEPLLQVQLTERSFRRPRNWLHGCRPLLPPTSRRDGLGHMTIRTTRMPVDCVGEPTSQNATII